MARDISEIPDQRRHITLSFWLALIFGVLPLWSQIPLAWAFVIYSIKTGSIWSFAWKGRLLFVVALCEAAFSIYHWHLAQKVQKPWSYGPGNVPELQIAFTRVLKAGLANLPEDGFDEESLDSERPGSPAEAIIQLEHDDPRAIDFRNVLRTWFGRVPWSAIRLHEIRQWLYWSIFNTDLPPLESLPQSHRVVLDDALDMLQKRLGKKVPEGSYPQALPMRLTLDNVRITWRPLSYYVTIWLVNNCLRTWFQSSWKMHHGSYDGLEYLLYIPSSWDPVTSPRPLVFMHGLGIGLFQYNVVLKGLLEKFLDRPLLLPLQPHVSQEIFHPHFLQPLNRHQTADRLAGLMFSLGWVDLQRRTDSEVPSSEEDEVAISLVAKARKGVTMISHSNGSYAHAWMLKAHPNMITRSCFVDPVTFCSWEGDACYNFIYRPCKSGLELLMRYFIGTELGVANLMGRHYDWSSNSLWFEEIPNARDPTKTFFLLGGKDAIINAKRVKRYLTSHGVRKGLWMDPNGRHGQALLPGSSGHVEILRWLQEPKY